MTGPDPKALLDRGGRMFADFTSGQKAMTAIAALVVLVGGFFFVRWVSTPAYAPLFTGLSSSDAASVTSALSDAGQAYQLADGGQTVLVPQADVYQQRVALAGEGLPAGDGATSGYSLLDEQSMTSSDFQQKVTYQRALEGELAKTVQAIDGIQSAVVHLAVPQEDVFTSDASTPTASVLVKTAPGKTLPTSAVDSIVNLVSGSVPKLAAEDVTVADASGQVLNAPGGAAGTGGSDARQTQQRAVSDATAASLQSMLDKVVGAGKAVVRVDATLNFDEQTTDKQTYIPTKPATTLQSQTSKETYTGSGASAGGVLGSTSTTTGGGGNGTYSKEETNETNALGTLKETVTSTPGKVERMSVAVLLDSAAAASVSSNDVSRLVTAAAGLDTTRGDVVEVTALPFDTTAAASAQAELEAAAEEAKQQNMIDLAKTGGLALLVLLALVFGFLRSRRRKGDAGEPAELEYYRVPDAPAPADAVLEMAEARGLPSREAGETQLVPALAGSVESMARENPDDVARLLRGWISEGAS